MSDVLKFVPRRAAHVLECMCGRQDCYICVDGSIECRGCGVIHSHRRHYRIDEHKLVKLDAPSS